MAGALLLVAFPPPRVTLVALRSRQPVHVEALEDSPYPGRADLDVVVPLEIHRDLHRSEVVMLAQMDDLLDYLGFSDRRAVQRRTGAVLKTFEAFVVVATLPPVEDVAADAVVAARSRHIPADLLRVLQYGQASVGSPPQIFLTPNTVSHGPSSIRSPDCQQPQSVLDFRHFVDEGVDPFEVRRRVGRVSVDLVVLDLTDKATRSDLGVDEADLVSDDCATTQNIACAACDAGFDAVLAPAAALPGCEALAVFVHALSSVTAERSEVRQPPPRLAGLLPLIRPHEGVPEAVRRLLMTLGLAGAEAIRRRRR